MPVVNEGPIQFINEVHARIREFREEDNLGEILELFSDKHGVKLIGYGSEYVVVEIDGEPTMVMAYTHKGFVPELMKEKFYAQRILATIFPHNFPRVYAVFGTDKWDKVSGTVRQKIESVRTERKEHSYIELGTDERCKFPFEEIIDTINKLELPIRLDTDEGKGYGSTRMPNTNFALAADGGIYYLDIPQVLINQPWKRQTLLSHMQSHPEKYSDTDIQIVLRSLDRIQAINPNTTVVADV